MGKDGRRRGDKKSSHYDQTEEEDLLRRSKRCNKGVESPSGMEGVEVNMENVDVSMESMGNSNRSTYKEVAMGFKGKAKLVREEDLDEGAISNDDVVEESFDPSRFRIGMTREEK